MKKMLSFMLSIILVISILTATIFAAPNFKDVPKNAWYKADFDYIMNDSRNIIAGFPDGTFKPNNPLTVAEFATCVVKASYFNSLKKENTTDAWYKVYVDKCKELKYIQDGEFTDKSYTRAITRGEMSRIIVRAVEYITGKPTYRDAAKVNALIGDYSKIPDLLKDYVVKTYDIGIIGGYPDGTFKAEKSLTRAEATAVLRKLIDPKSRNIPSLEKVEIVEGIKFSRTNDVEVNEYKTSNGAMKIDKQAEFAMKFYNSLRFYKSGSTNYVKGYLPNLPEGYKWGVSIKLFYKNDKVDSFFADNGNGGRKEILMYAGKEFKFALSGGKNELDKLSIVCRIISTTGADAGRFYLSYPEKTLEKYDNENTTKLNFDWGTAFSW